VILNNVGAIYEAVSKDVFLSQKLVFPMPVDVEVPVTVYNPLYDGM